MSQNNGELSTVSKDQVNEYCEDIGAAMLGMEKYIKTCETIDEEFNAIKALSLKTDYFRGICEGLANKHGLNIQE